MAARLPKTDAAPVATDSNCGAPAEGAPSPLDLKRSVRMHRGLFGLMLAAGLVGAAGYFFAEWPSYDAESLVYLQSASSPMNSSGVEGPPSPTHPQQSFMQQQMERVTRPEVLRGALARLPAGSWQHKGESEEDAEERLGSAITVEQVDGSQAGIIASASDATVAAALANAVAASFVESVAADRHAGDPRRTELLGEELERVKNAMAAERAELEKIKAPSSAERDDPNVSGSFDAGIENARTQLDRARTAHNDAARRLVSLAPADAASVAERESEIDEIAAADPAFASAKASQNQRRAQLIAQMANLPPSDPQNEQNAKELAQINASLEKVTRDLRARAATQIEEHLRDDLEQTWADEMRLNGQLAEMSGKAGSGAVRQRAADLASNIERLENLSKTCEESYRRLSGASQGLAAVHVSSSALPPMHPSVMRGLRTSLFIVLGAVILALASAVTAHHMDARVYTAADVERVLGCSPLAQIPDFGEVSGAVSEEYIRKLALAIEHAHQQDGRETWIVTGSGHGAGTSTVVAGVIAMLESMGRPTVLIEAPGKAAAAAGLERRAQSAELATEGAERQPGALPSRVAVGTEAEAIVFTDAAPLLTSKETEALAEFGDSVIVVIQSGLTTRAQLREVAQTLARLEVAVAGFVLNRVSMKANPSFRASVRDIEERLAVQNRLQARRSLWSRPSAQDRGKPQELSAVTESENVMQPDTPTSPQTSDQPATPEASAGAPAPTSPLSATETAAPPRVARGRGEPRRSAPSSRIPRHPFPPAISAGTATVPTPAKPVLTEPAPPLRSPVPARAAAPPRLPEPPVRPDAPAAGRQQANSSTERWTPATPFSRSALSRPTAQEPPPEMDDADFPVPSRLSGLRNLFVSRARRTMDEQDEANGEPETLEPRFERATVRPAYSGSSLSEADGPEGDTSAHLTAQPEFLPPRPMSDAEKEKEKEVVRPTPPRRENVDPEEIQTLPSWRGQYRKKRYPPM